MIRIFITISIISITSLSCRFSLPEDKVYDEFVLNNKIVESNDEIEISVKLKSYNFGFYVINDYYLFDLAGLKDQKNGVETKGGQSLDEYVNIGDIIIKNQSSDTIYIIRDSIVEEVFVIDFKCLEDPKCRRGNFWE